MILGADNRIGQRFNRVRNPHTNGKAARVNKTIVALA
jgi:transposase InsO family protein